MQLATQVDDRCVLCRRMLSEHAQAVAMGTQSCPDGSGRRFTAEVGSVWMLLSPLEIKWLRAVFKLAPIIRDLRFLLRHTAAASFLRKLQTASTLRDCARSDDSQRVESMQ